VKNERQSSVSEIEHQVQGPRVKRKEAMPSRIPYDRQFFRGKIRFNALDAGSDNVKPPMRNGNQRVGHRHNDNMSIGRVITLVIATDGTCIFGECVESGPLRRIASAGASVQVVGGRVGPNIEGWLFHRNHSLCIVHCALCYCLLLIPTGKGTSGQSVNCLT